MKYLTLALMCVTTTVAAETLKEQAEQRKTTAVLLLASVDGQGATYDSLWAQLPDRDGIPPHPAEIDASEAELYVTAVSDYNEYRLIDGQDNYQIVWGNPNLPPGTDPIAEEGLRHWANVDIQQGNFDYDTTILVYPGQPNHPDFQNAINNYQSAIDRLTDCEDYGVEANGGVANALVVENEEIQPMLTN